MARSLNYRVKPNAGSLFEIYWEGGGQVPDCLLGVYNSAGIAKQAILTFRSTVSAKVDARQNKPKRRLVQKETDNVSNG